MRDSHNNFDETAVVVFAQRSLNEHSPDRDLVEAVLDGDRSAFTTLVRRYDPGVRMLVTGLLRGSATVDDVMQDTYLKAFRSLASYQVASSFKAWLHRIAYTTAIDEIRRSRKVTALNLDDQGNPISSGAPRVDDRVVRRMDVLEALGGLTDHQRAVALLVDGHGYDYAEAGRILGMAAGTVGFHLNKARAALRAALADRNEED